MLMFIIMRGGFNVPIPQKNLYTFKLTTRPPSVTTSLINSRSKCSIGSNFGLSAVSWADGAFPYDFHPFAKENYRNFNQLLQLFIAIIFIKRGCKYYNDPL